MRQPGGGTSGARIGIGAFVNRTAHGSKRGVRCSLRVKLRRTQYEHMFSALPSNSDIARRSRHVSNVPILLQKSAAAEGLAAIKLMSAGFDPPTLAALRNFDATRCTKPE